ncbi:MAG: hypothetical protein NW217_17040 [Hyphomicrobiaceae bacterium]|nr:hypothetical protein [Hyphomicrobiaceae bacterium]
MWTIHRLSTSLSRLAPVAALAVCGFTADQAAAQFYNNPNSPYYYNNQTYTHGLNLPQVPIPNGQDEVRSADGTTCRSSMASNSAYLDVGAIGSQDYDGQFSQGTFYGRVIMPLGETPRRVDCSKLYELEIQRLRHELALMQGGLGGGFAPTAYDAPGSMKATNSGATLQVGSAATAPGRTTAAAPRLAASGQKSAWADTGWSNTGWQKPSRLGAPTRLNPPLPDRRPMERAADGPEDALALQRQDHAAARIGGLASSWVWTAD